MEDMEVLLDEIDERNHECYENCERYRIVGGVKNLLATKITC